jgi:hypothetical protein
LYFGYDDFKFYCLCLTCTSKIGFGEIGFGKTGFGKIGFGETGFGKRGFGETGFGKIGGHHRGRLTVDMAAEM